MRAHGKGESSVKHGHHGGGCCGGGGGCEEAERVVKEDPKPEGGETGGCCGGSGGCEEAERVVKEDPKPEGGDRRVLRRRRWVRKAERVVKEDPKPEGGRPAGAAAAVGAGGVNTTLRFDRWLHLPWPPGSF